MPTLEIDLLRTLIAIVDCGSYAAAADKVHRTQSAITQQMHKLEEIVDVPLFEKHGRNNRLTHQGGIFLEYAKRLIATHDEALRTLKEGDIEGGLQIGAPVDIADTILPLVLSSIARWSPRLQLGIHVSRSPVLMEALKRGEIDLAISTRYDPGGEAAIVRSSPTVWICSDQYVHNPSEPVRLILADEPSIFRRIALTALNDAQVPWQQSYQASSLIGIKSAIRANLGTTARSIELLGPGMRVLGTQDGLPALPNVNYYLLMRRDVISPVTRQVFNMIKDTFGLKQVTTADC